MEEWSGAALVKRARLLSRGTDKKKIAAIHAGIAAAAALIITLLQLALEEGIGQTSGLSGLGMRSVLQTAGTVLQIANSVLTPFWNLGFWFAALLWARERTARPGDLLMGFRRFGPYLRLMLLKGITVFSAAMLCAYASSLVYMMTPWAAQVTEFAQTVGMDVEAADQLMAQMDGTALTSLMRSMIPMLVIWGVLSIAVLVPLLYRFRMAEFTLLEDPRVGALVAMALSARMLRKRRWKLFCLDLRYWWYYALEAACLLFYSVELFLPVNSMALSLGLYVAYLAALFAVQTLARPQVQTAYALAYESLRRTEPVQPKPRPAPKKLPWDEV